MPTLVVPSPDTTARGTAQPTRSAPTEPHPERTSSPSPSPSAIPTASPQAGGGEDQLNETE
jgi:hypothetical protein